jgi:hypothetical protein
MDQTRTNSQNKTQNQDQTPKYQYRNQGQTPKYKTKGLSDNGELAHLVVPCETRVGRRAACAPISQYPQRNQLLTRFRRSVGNGCGCGHDFKDPILFEAVYCLLTELVTNRDLRNRAVVMETLTSGFRLKQQCAGDTATDCG